MFLKYVEKKDWSFVRLRTRHGPRLLVAGILLSLGAVAVFVAIVIASGFAHISPSGGSPWRVVPFLLLMLSGGFALVVLEEVIFRGYALRTLETSFNGSVAVVATAVLFALAHLARANVSVMGVLNICLMGCLLAVVSLRSDSLWLPIGLHFGWNSSLSYSTFRSVARRTRTLCSISSTSATP